jgi:hypothetical protein
VKQALEMLGDHVEAVLSADRSPHLLREFYASIGLGSTWHHDARRLWTGLIWGLSWPTSPLSLRPRPIGG